MSNDSQAPIRLLLVEDQPDLRKMLSKVLNLRGYQTVIAGTVSEALAALKSSIDADEVPHLVLSDLSLPDGDGIAFAREAQGLVPNLPIAFMSGYDSLQASGFDNSITSTLPLLNKPFTMDSLLAFLQECLAAGPVGSSPATASSE